MTHPVDIPRPRPPMPSPPQPDGIANLLRQAVDSGEPRLVRAADKISDLVEQLKKDVTEYVRGAELRAEAERLEARLAEIRGQIGSKRSAPSSAAHPGLDLKAVRAWAARQGLACPARGRIPHAVMAAYERRSP